MLAMDIWTLTVMVVTLAIGATLAAGAMWLFLYGKREANNMLWFIARRGPPQNNPRPQVVRSRRRARGGHGLT